MYGGIYWFSVGSGNVDKRKVFLFSSVLVLVVLFMLMALNLFFALFGAVLVMSLVAYISGKEQTKHGKQILHGAVGSLWLSIPIYVYLVANT